MAGDAGDKLAEGLGAMAGTVIVLSLIVAIWLTVKATELVVRVMVAHPTNRLMWAMLSISILAVLAVFLTSGEHPLVNSLAVAALGMLVLSAKVAEVYYDQLLRREWSREDLVHDVFHEPWWNAA